MSYVADLLSPGTMLRWSTEIDRVFSRLGYGCSEALLECLFGRGPRVDRFILQPLQVARKQSQSHILSS